MIINFIWRSMTLTTPKRKRCHHKPTVSAIRFHKTILQEFYQVTFRKKLYADVDSLQKDLYEWLVYYNNERTHQGKVCNGRTPMKTLLGGKQIWASKNLN